MSITQKLLKLSLKRVKVPMPNSADGTVKQSVARAEADMMENVLYIEDAISRLVDHSEAHASDIDGLYERSEEHGTDIEQLASDKYDKTGGTISGDAYVDGKLTAKNTVQIGKDNETFYLWKRLPNGNIVLERVE